MADLDDPEWLREQYREECRSMRDIAGELGVSPSTVLHHMQRHGIETRSCGQKTPGAHADPRLADEEWLRRRYAGERRTMAEMASTLGVVPQTVCEALRRHGIETRGPGPRRLDLDVEELRQKREEGMSWRELGEYAGCSEYAVRSRLDGE